MPRVITLSGLGAAQPPFRHDFGPHPFVTPTQCQDPVLPTNKGCGTPLECAAQSLQGLRVGGLRLGATDEATSAPWYDHPAVRIGATVAGAASAYHGYKRSGSIVWAVVWGFAGALFPFITVPVALAQGFGRRG